MVGEEDIRRELGLVQIYTGNGKGKTTAALGLALRASGNGLRVAFLQFLKPAAGYGEQIAAPKLGIDVIPMGSDRFVSSPPAEEDVEAARAALKRSGTILASGDYDLVVLDEAVNAVRLNLITSQELIDTVEGRAKHVEVVLTGRGITPDLEAYADLVTEMRLVKHPMDAGIDARAGIEF